MIETPSFWLAIPVRYSCLNSRTITHQCQAMMLHTSLLSPMFLLKNGEGAETAINIIHNQAIPVFRVDEEVVVEAGIRSRSQSFKGLHRVPPDASQKADRPGLDIIGSLPREHGNANNDLSLPAQEYSHIQRYVTTHRTPSTENSYTEVSSCNHLHSLPSSTSTRLKQAPRPVPAKTGRQRNPTLYYQGLSEDRVSHSPRDTTRTDTRNEGEIDKRTDEIYTGPQHMLARTKYTARETKPPCSIFTLRLPSGTDGEDNG
ncbi:hypothetical protein SODALDRAFT_379308 [Sodiomyces alkalinus F11]|uniref:Uncharacterized protein n=1 Tax=Sodiomyces alkalinus (strain CBS 110278 / VKM F-3762 / F11) TaxID=1314773 RepID=A0A3N2PUC4_SODAK|nr:hypothetical protein SODALDRAFT_379308 [Sodiomyces alkalinus F11]ROT38082.1 hypothetical protein SODALDRAFT_379308 [Sodiomyces alkalinus F11]